MHLYHAEAKKKGGTLNSSDQGHKVSRDVDPREDIPPDPDQSQACATWKVPCEGTWISTPTTTGATTCARIASPLEFHSRQTVAHSACC